MKETETQAEAQTETERERETLAETVAQYLHLLGKDDADKGRLTRVGCSRSTRCRSASRSLWTLPDPWDPFENRECKINEDENW